MSSNQPADEQGELDDEVQEYIDVLHDRIQFLTEEVEEAKQTIVQLQHEGKAAATDEDTIVLHPNDDDDLTRLVRYAEALTKFDEDEDSVSELVEELEDRFKERVDSKEDVHDLSVALLDLFLEHEEIAS